MFVLTEWRIRYLSGNTWQTILVASLVAYWYAPMSTPVHISRTASERPQEETSRRLLEPSKSLLFWLSVFVILLAFLSWICRHTGCTDHETRTLGIDIVYQMLAATSQRVSYPLILLTRLSRSPMLYALILHVSTKHWILSLPTIINSRYHIYVPSVSGAIPSSRWIRVSKYF